MTLSEWRASLAFAARLAAVTKITSALHISDPLLSIDEVRRKATLVESAIVDIARSAEEYQQLCDAKIANLPRRSLEFPTSEDEEYVPTPGGKTIGIYQNAVYHREGLFSAIYKAPAVQGKGYFASNLKSISKLVALKITTPSMMEPPHNSVQEANILKTVSSEHIIHLLDTFQEDGNKFVLVFPFMRCQLSELLHDNQISKDQVKICLKDLFSALAFIHEEGVIHRDVKPSNILLKSPEGPAYLSDFGVAWAPNIAGAEAEHSKITDVGTTCYRPPELLFGNKQYGCSLDLWAAGCTVAEALTASHDTLFDSGELGSDLALIQSMFKKLGTPTLKEWPEAETLPDWGKVQFHEYPAQPWSQLLPDMTEVAQDLVGNLVKYQSSARTTAIQILEHPYFTV